MTPLHSQAHLEKILQQAPALLWVTNAQKELIYVNQSWLDFTGRTLEEELGQGWMTGVHPEDLSACLEAFNHSLDNQLPYQIEYRLRYHDGQYRYILDRGVPIYDENKEYIGFTGSCMDVHEKHELQQQLEKRIDERTEELRKEKQLSDHIFNASVDMLIVYDKELGIKAFNKAAEASNLFKQEYIGKKILEVFPNIENLSFHTHLKQAFTKEERSYILYRGALNNIDYEIFFVPLTDANQEIYAVLVIVRDISERIKTERELQELNLALTERNKELQSSNEDLSSFNYVASHDLQEPLRKVNMFASRILETERQKLSPQSFQYFDRINSAIARMQNLINALLEYSRTESAEVKRIKTDLNKILREVVRILDDNIKTKNAVIDSEVLPTLPVIPLQIQQLFINLISNSLKYSKPGVDPHISIKVEKVIVPEKNNMEFWKIVFSDNGIGFDMQYKQKIFELFQRLHGKMEIEGTGIGLAICRKIVNNHEGFITAEGETGVGSSFSIFLPYKNDR